MNIQRKNSAHHFRMQSEREQTLVCRRNVKWVIVEILACNLCCVQIIFLLLLISTVKKILQCIQLIQQTSIMILACISSRIIVIQVLHTTLAV